jgi:hypothetical protein
MSGAGFLKRGQSVNLVRGNQHARLVDDWLVRAAGGLSTDQLVRLFQDALSTLRGRTLNTLSELTLHAILDRALHQGRSKYPILAGVTLGPNGISLEGVSVAGSSPAEATEAFRFLLLEYLTIVGNLTGGIMIQPLHRELSKIRLQRGRANREEA